MDFFVAAFNQYADFKGRTSRQGYWMFMLFYFIFYIVLAVADSLLGTVFLAGIFTLVLMVPSISISARRLHDTGRSGWWQLISLVPLIGIIVLIYFLVGGSEESNAYGDAPELSAV